MLFFEAQLLAMDEVPDRAIIDFETAVGQFGDKPAQGEVAFPDPLQQPGTMRAGDRLALMPAHLARPNAASLPEPPHPNNHRADPYAKLPRRSPARQTTLL